LDGPSNATTAGTRAGHKSFSTTEGYIREAENLRDGFGEVFPPLPPSLLVDGKPQTRRRVSASVSAFGSVPIAILARNKTSGVEAPRIELGAGRSRGRGLLQAGVVAPLVGPRRAATGWTTCKTTVLGVGVGAAGR
jgi:hypothetical protein